MTTLINIGQQFFVETGNIYTIICDPPQEFDAKGESTLTTRLHDTLSVP